MNRCMGRATIASILCVTSVSAQGSMGKDAMGAMGGMAAIPRTNWEFTAGTGSNLSSVSAGIVRSTKRMLDGYVRFGLGLRATFATGDLKLTPAGAKNVPAGVIDTLSLSSSALMLNVSGHASVLLTDRLEAGLNIDLAGVGAGSDRNASYRASTSAAATSVNASPSSTNLFLYGSNDRGSLNSEFFGAWRATDRVTIRGGLSHQLVEYRATRTLSSNTDRFRRYSNLAFVGIRIGR